MSFKPSAYSKVRDNINSVTILLKHSKETLSFDAQRKKKRLKNTYNLEFAT